MEIIHVSAECYPVAKAGGLGDVVGALPKYLNAAGHIAKVVMPMYRTKFLYENEWELVHEGGAYMGNNSFHYSVIKEKNNKLGFDLYLIDVNGLLDRERIYGYYDDTERFLSFQIAFCDWISRWNHRPDAVHVHDHHTALIPFMLQYCYAYSHLASIPTVLTIHNAQYQGWFGWDKQHLIPPYDPWKWGMLDWSNTINPLACGIKCASRVTTVSWSYLEELQGAANGLESLLRAERGKSVGILNGIDDKIWDPATDTYLQDHYTISGADKGKLGNKKALCEVFGLNPKKPLFVFIGRLVGEKAADLLPGAIEDAFYYIGRNMNILVLGSGEPWVETQLQALKEKYAGDYNVFIGYNETLSHQMYAGADFLLMPSRVEPCGLNQMYAMRYGTVPLVRDTGGLRDTVIDIGDHQGYGIRFREATVGELTHAMYRALDLYKNKEQLEAVREYMMKLDFSWDKSAEQYCNVYQSIIS
ncbi:MAG: glycogen synthase [Chitinophagaceae bacterium]